MLEFHLRSELAELPYQKEPYNNGVIYPVLPTGIPISTKAYTYTIP